MDFPRANFFENFSHTKNIFWIFPKTISKKKFPETSQKIFPAHATNARFAIFLKMPHRTFRETSCIQSPRYATTLRNGNCAGL
jgi:hypothetical protein